LGVGEGAGVTHGEGLPALPRRTLLPVDSSAAPPRPDPGTEPRTLRLAPPTRPAPRWIGGASWLVAPLLLAAAVGTLVLLRAEPKAFFGILLGAVVLVPIAWGLVSVFFPAYPDRRCPECRELAVAPLESRELHGLRCEACGWRDASASAWKFVEEGDAPLEPLVAQASERRSTP